MAPVSELSCTAMTLEDGCPDRPGEELRSTMGYSDARSCEDAAPDIADLITTLRDRVFQRRIRAKDAFRDFDKLHHGRCTKQQFLRAVRSIPAGLEPQDIKALAEHFTEYGRKALWPRVVNYAMFCDVIDEVFGPSHLETKPKLKVPPPGTLAPCTYGYTPCPVADMVRFHDIMRRIAVLVETRAVQLEACFTSASGNFLRGSGKVTQPGFLRRFPLTEEFSASDMQVLFERYRTEDDGVHAFAFARDVAAMGEWLKAQANAEAPPSQPRIMPRATQRPASAGPTRLQRSSSEAFASSAAWQRSGGDPGRRSDEHPQQQQQQQQPAIRLQRPASAVALRRSSAEFGTMATCSAASSVRPRAAAAPSPAQTLGATGDLGGTRRSFSSCASSSEFALEIVGAAARPRRRPASAVSDGSGTRRSFASSIASTEVLREAATPVQLQASFASPATSISPTPSAAAEQSEVQAAPAAEPPARPRVRPVSAMVLRRRRQEAMPKVDAIAKVRHLVYDRRLRVLENFRDFDRLRKGCCTEEKLKAVLALLGIDLSSTELTVLLDRYRSEDGHFLYADFVVDVEGRGPEPTMKRDGKATLDAQQLKEFEKIVSDLAAIIRKRNMEIRSVFCEFAQRSTNSPPGHVTCTQLGRILSTLGFTLDEYQVDLLCQAYCDSHTVESVNFLDLLADIDPQPADGAQAEKLVVPTTRYFDQRGRVVPHRSIANNRARPSSAPSGGRRW